MVLGLTLTSVIQSVYCRQGAYHEVAEYCGLLQTSELVSSGFKELLEGTEWKFGIFHREEGDQGGRVGGQEDHCCQVRGQVQHSTSAQLRTAWLHT